MPEIQKDITIKTVKVFPEGMCAYFGVLFKKNGIIRPEYKYLTDSNESTVIFDIGAGTTDIVMVKGSQVVQSSRFTKEVGGNNVHRLVQRSLRNRGISLPDEAVRDGVNTGSVRSGSRTIDISEDIASAKSAVSNQLVDAVQEFFESSMISIRTIANILVCGGGAEISENERIEPIANYIVNYMSKLSPDIKLIELPYEVTADGDRERMSPRLLNIMGAGILAE
jgi:actin-like ATPase involved in cell morphogenesis